ncbi:MAG: tRNA uridine-5-carboxymethylaminomethyl(34) synthesis enzyme MnmG [Phycisphaerales bacterium]|nr:tRNA uridine-5-carboxymethylaminomethyl(34) synthesis enzyme MnmG [Phycisphaerales bacterium]
MDRQAYRVIVIGGGHAGVEAAWAAANLLPAERSASGALRPTVALVTLDPAKIGVMSCNPAIGGLAKGQLVREVDAMGGLMGLAADATGIHFKVLNTSKGPAVHGPRCQNDKHAYAEAVQALIASRPEIEVIAAAVEGLIFQGTKLAGVRINTPLGRAELAAPAIVLTTGTFMRGLMHTGEKKSAGGRHGEAPSVGISDELRRLGFELGRLKTGTPPRLRKSTIDWDNLPVQPGDDQPLPFSDLTERGPWSAGELVCDRFPLLEQLDCRQTRTTADAHEHIRQNLHRAPMFSGQIESVGPRYCPSIEDKVNRFADRESHGVFLEPESWRSDWVYCNGIATSLPEDVQLALVRAMPGCDKAEVLQYGYAVEYDMVRPHQIHATGMTKSVEGLFLAGQINGTSGYEEAAAQGLVAGLNAARFALGEEPRTLGRHEAYIGVLMDDLVTKTPVEPYRMFTSRAEHRLLLRADNSADRLTPLAEELGLLSSTELGRMRLAVFQQRRQETAELARAIAEAKLDGEPLTKSLVRSEFGYGDLRRALPGVRAARSSWMGVFASMKYAPYIERQEAEIRRQSKMERKRIPSALDFANITPMRKEARQALGRFRPETFGQAGRLEGVTPADLTLLAVVVERFKRGELPPGVPVGAA